MEFFAKVYVHAPVNKEGSVPNAPHVDLDAEMKKIREQYQDCTKSAYEYLRAMQTMLFKFKDLHYVMAMPSMFGNINQISPMSIIGHPNGTMTFVPLEMQPLILKLYNNQIQDLTPYLNIPIKTINGKDPYTFMQEWADVNVPFYSTQGSRFNQAMLSTFAITEYTKAPPVEETFDVVLYDNQEFSFKRVVAFNTPIPDYAAIEKLWTACLKKNPYEDIEPLNLEVNGLNQEAPEPELLGRKFKSIGAEMTDVEDFKLITYLNNFFAGYEYLPTGDFILQIVGFGSSYFDTGMTNMLNFLEHVKNNKKEGTKLFLSLTGNGGGDPLMSALVVNALFPEFYPMFPRTQMRRAPFWDLTARGFTPLWQIPLYEPVYGGSIYKAQITKDWVPSVWREATQYLFGDEYSKDFHFVSPKNQEIVQKYLDFDGLKINPENIIVITDGVCASAAGYLTESLRQRKAATFVRLGGGNLPGDRFNQLCAVPGGAMHASSLYEISVQYNLQQYSKQFTAEELVEMQKYYLPHDGYHYITTYQTFGFDTMTPMTTPLDFAEQHADIQMPFIQLGISNWGNPQGLSLYIPELLTILKTYDKGLGDQCLVIDGVKNAIYRIQKPDQKCVFFACKRGFYPVMNGLQQMCLPRTDPWFTPAEPDEPIEPGSNNSTSYMIAVIVLSILLGLMVVASLILAALLHKAKHPGALDVPLVAV